MLQGPLTEHWIARLHGEGAQLHEMTTTNTRIGGRAAIVFRAYPGLEFLASAGTLRYKQATTAGYSAPKRTTSGELGAIFEVSHFWPLYLSVDAAAGAQRVTPFNTTRTVTKSTFRWFSSLGWELWPGTELVLDIEHDNALERRTAATTNEQWRSTSALLSLRFGAWRQDRAIFLAPQSSGGFVRNLQ